MKTPPGSTDLGSRMVSGAAWMVLFRLAERSLGLISTIILARLLVPDDFGLVAMATTVVAFLEVFTMNDFGSSIIQNKNAERAHYDTAWTMDVLLGLAASMAIVGLAYPAAHYFQDPRVAPILLVLAIYPLLDGSYNVGCVEFRKNLQFDKDFYFQVTKKLSGVVISIPLAIILQNYWALVGGLIAGRAGFLVASYRMHPFRPRWSLAKAAEIWAFSKWILVNNALGFLNGRGAHLLIGRFGTAHDLGTYSVAYDIANLPTSELAVPINRAAFPGYSTIQHDAARMQAGFLRVVGLVAFVTVPAGVGLAVVAPLLVPLLLGQQWIDAVPIMQIIAIGGAVLSVQANVESVYFALGRTRLRATITALQVAIVLPLTAWFVWSQGVIGAAWAFLIGSAFVTLLNFSRAASLLQISGHAILRELWRPIAASAVMAGSLLLIFDAPVPAAGTLALLQTLVLQSAAGALIFGSTSSLLWFAVGRPAGAETWLLDKVAKLRRYSRPA